MHSLEELHFSLRGRRVLDNPSRRLDTDTADVELTIASASDAQIYHRRESLDAGGRTRPVLIMVMRSCHVKSRQVLKKTHLVGVPLSHF